MDSSRSSECSDVLVMIGSSVTDVIGDGVELWWICLCDRSRASVLIVSKLSAVWCSVDEWTYCTNTHDNSTRIFSKRNSVITETNIRRVAHLLPNSKPSTA